MRCERQRQLPGTSAVAARVQGFRQSLQANGLALETAQRGAAALLARTLKTQTLLRYCLNYSGFVSLGVLALPPLHRQAVSFRARPL